MTDTTMTTDPVFTMIEEDIPAGIHAAMRAG
jgi:hypothetical protein